MKVGFGPFPQKGDCLTDVLQSDNSNYVVLENLGPKLQLSEVPAVHASDTLDIRSFKLQPVPSVSAFASTREGINFDKFLKIPGCRCP